MATELPKIGEASTDSTAVSLHSRYLVGTGANYWIYSSAGWDLTRPTDPESNPLLKGITIECELTNIKIDPCITALVVIDMQNINLHQALNPSIAPAIIDAQEAILKAAIPAARKLGIQILWLNWGLEQDDLENLPPAEVRLFAFQANTRSPDYGLGDHKGDPNDPGNFQKCGEKPDLGRIPGAELGNIRLDDGSEVDAGRMFMRESWNTAIHGSLAHAYEEGKSAARPDVLLYKNRNSGLWNERTELSRYLKEQGIRTLVFAGANIDQCVGATLQDAHAQGFDTIMLKDGCATDSPHYTKASWEFNCVRAWGFLSSCWALAEAAGLKHDCARIKRTEA